MSDPIPELIADRQKARQFEDGNADICFLALSEDNQPSVRTLVLREISEDGFTLFINNTSQKWKTIGHNDRASLLLWYPTIQRQYRVVGKIIQLDNHAVATNWPRKPTGSKYLDYAYESLAPQGTPVDSRQQVVEHINALKSQISEDELTTPPSATAILLQPASIERLDLNQVDRIHDRRRYEKNANGWQVTQLMP